MGEALIRPPKYTYKEFLAITKDMERAEFIDGEIILQSTPTLNHQNIVLNIASEFKSYFKGKECKPFIAPFDIILKNENEETKRVQPDIFILCGEKPSNQNEFVGVPALIIEVTSPSNAGNDILIKLNLYQRFGVPEYWIVSPKNKSVQVFQFDEKTKMYYEPMLYSKDDIVNSTTFNDLSIELKSIFE